MTARTRRRLTLLFVLALVTFPAETILFPVALTPDSRKAASEWVHSLSPDALRVAAADIESYPPLYRRAIMGELKPANRSVVWQSHFSRFQAAHPDMTADQAAVLRDALEVSTPDVFAPGVREEVKLKVGEIYGRAIKAFGPKTAGELFVSLGPKTVDVANALPLRQRIGDRIRSWRTVTAFTLDCNCNVEIDTCDLVPDPWLQCSELYTCNFDLTWPMCGPLWSWACTGWCSIIRWPDGGSPQ